MLFIFLFDEKKPQHICPSYVHLYFDFLLSSFLKGFF